jgi:hypothetical protein
MSATDPNTPGRGRTWIRTGAETVPTRRTEAGSVPSANEGSPTPGGKKSGS